MGDHIHPPLEGMLATLIGNGFHIMTYNGVSYHINHIHPPLEGTWETTFTLVLRECGPLLCEVRHILSSTPPPRRDNIISNHIHSPLGGNVGGPIQPPTEGNRATPSGSEIHTVTPPGVTYPINHIQPPLEGTCETTFTLYWREYGPFPSEVNTN